MRSALVSILAIVAFTAAAQDDADDPAERAAELDLDGETQNCLNTRSVRRTQVIDDSTIAFFMRNRDVYVNLLPRRCPQLARNDRFAYEARGGRLCKVDTITVLTQFAGRLEGGFTCPLGEFHVTDAESVELMIEAVEQRGRTSPVTAEPVELPPEDDSETDESESTD